MTLASQWYWVNQGQHQAEETTLGIICAPVPSVRSVPHWDLDRIPIGSTLLGCARREVEWKGRTTGRAGRHPVKPYPDPKGDRDVWVVPVDWSRLLRPLRVDRIPLWVRAGHTPFNVHGDGRQQYCIEIPSGGPVHEWLIHNLSGAGVR